MNRERISSPVMALTALALAIAAISPPSHAATVSSYVRIAASPKATVYARFTGNDLQLATSPGGLAKARVIRGTVKDSTFSEFRNVTLPVSRSRLTNNWSSITATFHVHAKQGAPKGSQPDHLCLLFGVNCRDARGALWTCTSDFEQAPAAASVAKSQLVSIPQKNPLKLELAALVDGEELGIGVRAMAGNSGISDITRNGNSADVLRVTVRDAGGKVVETATGPLSKFGFG